ncbi:hypothetical protein HYQ44_002965 [Verticillium longisporum]|nr:hypothetical protein HYQ44_002965 [Verticillium longisporum]
MTEEYREIEAQIRGSSTSKPELLMDMLPTGQNVKAEVKAEVNTPPPTKSKDSPLAHPVRKLRHPRCAETFLDGNSFQNHLHDLHHVPKKFFLPVETGLKRGMDDATQEEIPAKKTKLEEAPVETRFVFQYCNVEETESDR